MAHVSRDGEVVTGRGRTAVRIGWVERDGSGWRARPRVDLLRSPHHARQADAVAWLYAWQRSHHDPAARAALAAEPLP